MIELIDSHCHLTSEGLREQVGAVLERAAAAGVTTCLTVAQDLADAEQALALAAAHPQVRVAAGIHPHVAAKAPADWADKLHAVTARADVCAVGETGLDYHYDFSDRASQMRAFRGQLEIATAVGKPVIIHCREAFADVMTTLAEYPRLPGVVFHCFSEGEAEARELLERGYHLSLTGVVTFKNAAALRQVAKTVPADRLMLETEPPYLSPEPVRKIKPNEPALMVHTAVCVAKERGLTLEQLASLTTANARRFFKLPPE
jgi:TatD DNase family protein